MRELFKDKDNIKVLVLCVLLCLLCAAIFFVLDVDILWVLLSMPLAFFCAKYGSDVTSTFVYSVLAIAFLLIGTYLGYHLAFLMTWSYFGPDASLGRLLLDILLVCYALALIGVSFGFVTAAASFFTSFVMALFCLSIAIVLAIVDWDSQRLVWQAFAYPFLLLVPRFFFVEDSRQYDMINFDNPYAGNNKFFSGLINFNIFLTVLGFLFASFGTDSLPYTDVDFAPILISITGFLFACFVKAVPIGYHAHTVPDRFQNMKARNTWIGLVLYPICLIPYVVPLLMGL